MGCRPRHPSARRPRGQGTGEEAVRPDRRAVGGAGGVAAQAEEARSAAEVEQAAVDGIRWRVRTGAPWRDVPDCYGHWRSVYGLYRRWQRDGTWARILTGLQGQADVLGLITWDVSVDSTIARAHQHAAGARKRPDLQLEPPGGVGGDEPDDHAMGRSRCGWTPNLHLACDHCLQAMSLAPPRCQRVYGP